MAHIDYLTGEPLRPLGENQVKMKHMADVIRDEWASYEISSLVYEGGYRYRRTPLEVENAEESSLKLAKKSRKHKSRKKCALPDNKTLYIRGSWTGWEIMEEMEPNGDEGWYVCTVVLGESRCEYFQICMDEDMAEQAIYPSVDAATPKIWICGPDDRMKNQRWAIDGRNEKVPAGTVYQIHFKWDSWHKKIYWEKVGEEFAEEAWIMQHMYSVVGSWTAWKPRDLMEIQDEKDDEAFSFEGKLRIGVTGQEEFHFVRDHDPRQSVYPARPQATKASVPICGPDDLCCGKNWLVKGPVGDVVSFRLSIKDARVTLTTQSETKGTKIWESREGWARHEYFVVSPMLPGGEIAQLLQDPESPPGVFKCRRKVGLEIDQRRRCYVDAFQVVVEGDAGAAFYPEHPEAGSGECIVMGPNDGGKDKHFLVRSPLKGEDFEITLDLNAEDRRKIVTWNWAGALRLRSPVADAPSTTAQNGS
eukprot:gnl/TRDRNA2_/TRDRNA2_133935_c0_seq1.p1 gnl/TRDRNA2_/TRDRNA2_133935_c0~~gnl/TRDRNA2_/TRDRNA2_133935_c0_seq1.p1  ORF type:complete len:518 (-),score=113.13 gnl/TRDRNA2_/TRDRNA2_133935_c0_seq1:30-1454(-)